MENNDSILSAIESRETEATYIQRALSNGVDVVIEITIIIGLSFLISALFPGIISSNAYVRYSLVLAVMLLYRLLSVLLFQKTIGMIVLRLKYLNTHLEPLSRKEQLLAVAPFKTSRVKIYKEQ